MSNAKKVKNNYKYNLRYFVAKFVFFLIYKNLACVTKK